VGVDGGAEVGELQDRLGELVTPAAARRRRGLRLLSREDVHDEVVRL